MTEGMRPLQGRTALMSGAAKGAGADVALALAEQGANICLLTHNIEHAKTLVERIEEAGGRGMVIACMVDDERQLESAMDEAEARFGGGIDIMFTNMGLMPDSSEYPKARVCDLAAGQWESYMRNAAQGAIVSIACAARRMRRQADGGIIINTAPYGMGSEPGLALYAASRASIRAVVDAVNMESDMDDKPISAHLLVNDGVDDWPAALADRTVRLCSRMADGLLDSDRSHD